MSKLNMVGIILIIMIIASGAGLLSYVSKEMKKDLFKVSENSKYNGLAKYKVIVDEQTGCEYLQTESYRGGITPRMDATGTQVCNLNNIVVGK